MSEAPIGDLLERYVAPFEFRPDGWNDVLARARRTRRRYALVGAAIAALLLVPTAVALRGQIADLFQGTPAPPAISSSFEDNNKMADYATQQGFVHRFPHADVAKAHGVLEVQTSDGPEDLWAAPNDQGGQCWFVDFANDPPGPDGRQYGFGGCYDSTPPASNIAWGAVWVEPHPTLFTLSGHVFVPAVRVEVRLEDGSTRTLPVVEGFFLESLDKGAQVSQISAYDASGDEVASFSKPS
jgi:hypothetical protein